MTNKYDKTPVQYLRESRIVHLCGDLTTSTADEIVSRLFVLDAHDHEAEIKLYVTSYGGSVYAGLAIYDAMQTIEAPVSTLCIGAAFSVAACVLAAGARGRRFATENSRIMLHQAPTGAVGTSDDIRVAAAHVVQTDAVLVDLLATHTGQPTDDVRRAIERDLWLSPDQAEAFGILDGVIAPNASKTARKTPRSAREPRVPLDSEASRPRSERTPPRAISRSERLSAAAHRMLPGTPDEERGER
jgi:ATP-dependent Clp protease protease subunit